ncbi:heat shock protein DnaJ domain protein [Halothece sp. PCC 7418]|uniref:hypothetical protein n=1 Tax=Halothece sp. (strain PCC 7418) TaxID=65093 RepID=UPI0002A06E49|nr:hypothetical protein [Halothece sp. PCC 7418]AFZ42744.1 heat shock protein DnaJ domain protein [Halothece sp. PCC 7418]
MESQITPNPYDVLEVSSGASKKEIMKAFTQAMKRKKYSPSLIAEARKKLSNPQERLKADYLRPIFPITQRFKRQNYSELEQPAPELKLISEFDKVQSLIDSTESVKEIDKEIGIDLVNSL